MNITNLTVGAYGSNVFDLQQALSSQGFQIPTSEAKQAFFGPATRQAVMAFQAANGISKTGQVDASTASFLSSGTVPPATTATPATEPVPATAPIVARTQSTVATAVTAGTAAQTAVVAINPVVGQQVLAPSAPPRRTKTPTGAVKAVASAPRDSGLSLRGANLQSSVLDNLTTAPSAAQTAINTTLNAKLKTQLTRLLGGTPVLAGLVPSLPTVNLAAANGLTLQSFLKQQLTPLISRNPAAQKTFAAELATVSDTTTIGGMLGLSKSLQLHPLFQRQLGNIQLGGLLSTDPALNSTQLQNDFINAYTAFTGSMPEFWNQLSQKPQFKQLVPRLQLTLQLGAFTFNNVDLVTALRNTVKPSQFRDLTQLTTDKLAKLITASKIQVSASIPGATSSDKTTNYATAMMSLLTAAFPTDFIAQGFRGSRDTLNQAVATFLSNSQDFDFASTNVRTYVSQNSLKALKGITQDQKTVINRLLAVQRVFRVNSDPTVIQKLIGAGLDSARKIASPSQAVFLREYGDLLGGDATGLLVYNSAKQISGTVSNFYRAVQEGLQPVPLPVIGGLGGTATTALNQVIPDWQSLFGATSYCECDECSAMDGPAAYYVDVLQFLQGVTNASSAQNSSDYTPLDVLIGYNNNPNNFDWTTSPATLKPAPDSNPPLGRRPDLAYLDLTCANSDTPLPYVDLINEILEAYVYNAGSIPDSSNNTPSDALADVLSLNPEYTIQTVYSNTLPLAVYPFSLPYDRFLDTARIYLNFLGSSRYQLMQTFGIFPANSTDQAAMMAAESLGMSELEYSLVTGVGFNPSSPPTTYQAFGLYGYPSATVTQPDSSGSNQTLPWEQWLVQVPEFLKRTGLAYADLISLVETQYLNPGQAISLQASASDPCDLESTTIAFPDSGTMDTFFAEVPPFLRLLQKLGWQICDLDKALSALENGMGRSFVLAAAQLQQLQGMLNIPIDQISTLWSNIDVDGRDSLYNLLFQNKAVINPVDAAFQLTYLAPLADLPSVPPEGIEFIATATIGGTMTIGDQISLSMTGPSGSINLTSYPVGANDTPSSIAATLASQIDSFPAFQSAGVSATAAGPTITFSVPNNQNAQHSWFVSFTPVVLNGTVTESVSFFTGLAFTGAMADEQRDDFLAWAGTNDAAILAVQNLYNQRFYPGTDVASPQLPISPDHINTILAGLQISSADLTAIAVDAGLATVGSSGAANWNPQAQLTLANLSLLYRYALLAGALNFSVDDLISLKTLTGINPFQLAASDPVTNATLQFVQAAQTVTGSNFSVAQLNYIYRALPDIADNLPPLQTDQDQLAATLSTGLQNIANANAFTSDPSGTTLRKKLSVLLPASQVDLTMNLINGSALFTAAFTPPSGTTPFTGLSFVASATIGGTATTSDTVTLSIAGVSVTYVVAAGDDPNSIAANLAALVGANTTLSASQISATVLGPVITFSIPASVNPYPSIEQNVASATAGGTPTETLTLFTGLGYQGLMTSTALTGLLSLSSNSDFVSAVTNLYNQGQNVLSQNLYFLAPQTTYAAALSSLPAGLQLPPVPPGQVSFVSTGTIGTAITAGTQLALTMTSSGVSGMPVNLSPCAVTALDTPSSIAAKLAAAVSANPTLGAANITASVSGPIITFSAAAAIVPTPVWSVNPPGAVTFFNGLVCTAPLSNSARNGLLDLSNTNPGFIAAVNSLYDQAWNQPTQLLTGFSSPSDAYEYALQNLLSYLQVTQSADLVKQTISQSLNLDPVLVALLLEGDATTDGAALIPSQTLTQQPPQPAVIDFFGGLLANYFTEPDLTGLPQTQIDPGINVDGTEAPFGSAQWLGRIVPPATDTYSFQISIPTGAPTGSQFQIWVDDQLIIDTANGVQTSINLTAGQVYNFQLNVVSVPAAPQFQLRWSNSTTSSSAIPSAAFVLGTLSLQGELLGNYFSGDDLTGLLRTQTDPGIGLIGTEAAFSSAQWLGQIVAPTTDTYSFNFNVPGGAPTGSQVQLWINNILLIDTVNTPNVQIGINLTAGQAYAFQLNVVNVPAAAQFQLQWSNSTIPATTIPFSAFSTAFIHGLYATLSLLYRVAALVNGVSMQASDVAYLSAHSQDFQGADPNMTSNVVPFDLSILPLDGSAVPQTQIDLKSQAFFNQWQRLNNLYALKRQMPPVNTTLFDVFAIASESPAPGNAANPVSSPVATAILQATGWNRDDWNTLASSTGFALADIDFTNEITLVTLAACLSAAKRLGISAQQLLEWANNAPDANQAQDIINTVKAKFNDSAWLQAGKPLNDQIRTNSKQALIGYILNMAPILNLGLTDADDLYDYFLIDVQMCTCMQTSRIVQATAAAQQFVQRCLLNLENGNANTSLNVSPAAIDGAEWESWRQNYRIWQAAVQIFLYPENWIDPTLRDNRTPFFQDLQNQLLQASVTSDNATTACLSYLQSLWQVARLEIVGLFVQTDSTTGANINHVFGRTYSSPHIYFYRTLDNNTGVWSAWEKVTADINADQLIPVVWNNRLYVFWPHFKETNDPATNNFSGSFTTTNGSTTGKPGAAEKLLEVTLSWSEYRQGQWTQKETMPDSECLTPWICDFSNDSNTNTAVTPKQTYTGVLDTTQFAFSASVSGDTLTINMYQFPMTTPTCYVLGSFTFSGAVIITYQASNAFTDPDFYSTVMYNNLGMSSWPYNMEVAGYNPWNWASSSYSGGFGLPFANADPQVVLNYTPFYQLQNYPQLAGFPGVYVFGPQQYSAFFLLFPQELAFDFSMTSGSPASVLFYQDPSHTYYLNPVTTYIIRQLAQPDFVGPSAAAPPPSRLTGLATVGSSQNPAAIGNFSPNQYLPSEQWKYWGQFLVYAQTQIQFNGHYHPWVSEFIKLLNWKDVPGLMDITTQQLGVATDPSDPTGTSLNNLFNFNWYQPLSVVAQPYPVEVVDFSPGGAYSIYNWELFFHIPLLIATQLSQNQQFQDAQTWFHYIFNPTIDSDQPTPNRYWNFLFFNENTQDGVLADLLNTLMNPDSAGYQDAYNQVTQWWTNPADPDLIARLRPVAYQKTVVMKYLDNLIAWGDYLFTQNTRESINEATQIYVLADKILGPAPVMVPPQGTVLPVAFKDLQWNSLDNAMVQLENVFPFALTTNTADNGNSGSGSTGYGAASTGSIPYFCTPPNSQLLTYWATVADRLYKIRHCMNIQGQVQQLPLFAPPINPGLLVEAAAAGVDLSSALSDINAAVPYYRFTYMLSKALELCAEVRGLGGSLLSALEKKDAEALGLLRAGQEVALLQSVLQMKQDQLKEANANLQALQDSLVVTQAKQTYYQTLVSGGLSAMETGQVTNLTKSQNYKQSSQTAGLVGSELSLIPQFAAGGSGAGGTPVVTGTFGGQQLSTVASMVAQSFSAQAEYYSFAARLAELSGGWARRGTEWGFQLQTAGLEITQINDQINAATLRAQTAQDDLNDQNLQITNAQAVQDFLVSKYTNEDLYSWMIDQISGVYFQCYQMAYDLAKRSEACFCFELGLPSSNYIQFGYWDSLKQGLLSGEKLYLDLKRLEGAYLDQNKREYEISRSISLVLLDPIALITLKETGQCIINLPEAFFDMDYPGHYMRRIKSLSLTIPCVTGPYTSVNCTVTLMQSKIRWDNTSSQSSYPENPVASDPRFFYNFAAFQSIATSTAQNDAGMFEVNFHDERYLPFEGGGAISQWMISMPQNTNDFDFESITDVVLNLKYTARDGGVALQSVGSKAAVMPPPLLQPSPSSASPSYPSKQPNLVRYFSLKHEFPTEWYQFLNPGAIATSQIMVLPLTSERFPFQYRGKKIKISQVQLFLKLKLLYPPAVSSQSTPLVDYIASPPLPITLTPGNSPAATLVSASTYLDGMPYASIVLTSSAPLWVPVPSQASSWTLTVQQSDVKSLAAGLQYSPASGGGPFLNAAAIDDLLFVCQYSAG